MAESAAGNGAFFRVGSPGLIKDANITALDLRYMATTAITISFRPVTTIPIGGILQFEFDHIYFVFPNDKSVINC